jgi:urease gamma subunit
MRLAPREAEKLALHNAGFLAQKRLARGLRLNYTEAIALIAAQILEFVRDGDKTVTDLMDLGKQLLGRWVCILPELLRFPASLRSPSNCNIKTWRCITQMIMEDYWHEYFKL